MTRSVTLNGVKMSISQACKKTGVPYATAMQRIHRDPDEWPPLKAVTTPVRVAEPKTKSDAVAAPVRVRELLTASVLIRLPKSLHKQLRTHSKKTKTSVNEVVRQAISRFVDVRS